MRTNVNVTYASESLSKMMAVCRRLPETVQQTLIRRGEARSGPAREHPSGPFGDKRGRRQPRKSGAGRVAPTVAAAPEQPRRGFGRREPLPNIGSAHKLCHW